MKYKVGDILIDNDKVIREVVKIDDFNLHYKYIYCPLYYSLLNHEFCVSAKTTHWQILPKIARVIYAKV